MDHAGNLDAGIYMEPKYTRGSSVFQYWHVPCKDQREGIPNWISQSWEVWIIKGVWGPIRWQGRGSKHSFSKRRSQSLVCRRYVTLWAVEFTVRCGLSVHPNHICLAVWSHICFLREVMGTGMFRERVNPVTFSSSWLPWKDHCFHEPNFCRISELYI